MLNRNQPLDYLILFILVFNVFSLKAQVGIGTDSPHSSSILDITSSDSGILIPRISLQNSTDTSVITSPINSLLIYNLTTIDDVTPGFYYWQDTKWLKINADLNPWKLNGNENTNPGTYAVPGDDFIGTIDNEDLVFKTNNTEAMRILENGSVAIGSDTANDPLDVNGDIEVGGKNPADVDFESENVKIRAESDDWMINVLNSPTPSLSNFYIGPNSSIGDALFLITPSGDVAIGDDDDKPNDKLHVVDDQNSTTAIRIDNTNDSSNIDHTELVLYDGSTEKAFFAHNNFRDILSIGHKESNGQVYFYSGSGSGNDVTMVMDNNNRVGIGKDDLTPSDILHVVDDQNNATVIRIDNSAAAKNTVHTALRLYDGDVHKASFQYNNFTDELSIGTTNQGGEVQIVAGDTEVLNLNEDRTTIQTLINIKPSTTPLSPLEGDVYYDNVSKKLRVFTDVTWENLN